jgi:hypothetical protein
MTGSFFEWLDDGFRYQSQVPWEPRRRILSRPQRAHTVLHALHRT